MSDKKAIIVGAGPAGLTAAFELLERTEVKPTVLEKTDVIGGISRTMEYKGNRFDIGPHRFFSKSDRVMDWWANMIPIEQLPDGFHEITYQNKKRTIKGDSSGATAESTDNIMILLQRKTRIYYLRKFFDYPISLKVQTFSNLGLVKTFKIGCSYLKAAAFPIKPENNLEEFITNRFGKELYRTFFKDYTEKVWGIECHKISAAWGAQRIKGLNIFKALYHAARKIVQGAGDLRQKNTETSLVEQFLYPKLGTGSMWIETARRVKESGGEILMNLEVEKLKVENNKVVSALVRNSQTGETQELKGDYFFSTMPIKELIAKLDCDVPANVREVAEGLVYRDFIEVCLLVKKMKVKDKEAGGRSLILDNWIYIQESDVLVGRMQIYNNWGPAMVADPNNVWLGMEYFCNETDDIWTWPDDKLIELGGDELQKIGIVDKVDVMDGTVVRMPKTYPGYFGTYDRFDELRAFVDKIENLFLVGRNGMHKYNNQDHSMLASMTAVDNIVAGITTKENVWDVNTEMEYHEEKST
ncbi:MAG: NAD(P)/FAD-dependent oxidoreductase [Candidatus Obscuribacterales bacterium]|nr:NAD(P)/FAD-dependent oxidoreductase [Candidatus Obscuribacterales bacterium]